MNPTWGSPRIVGELRKLGISVAKSTVERYRPRRDGPLSVSWKTFLDLHVKDLASIDFFVVPTARFKLLFVFIVVSHDRRRILHFNVTEHPTVGRHSSCWEPSRSTLPRAMWYEMVTASTEAR